MWSQLLLCALVGFAAASDYGWKSNTEYMYKVHGRTLTSLHDVADQYAGVVMKANLIIRPDSNGQLMAKISDAKYAQVHTQLPEGWKSDIPESKLQYQQLQLSDNAFQIVLKNGVIRNIIVSKNVPNWEANIVKALVSQVNLDTQGENVIKSHINQLPEKDSNSAIYKTMEDTVTGKYETLYEIGPLAEHVLQSQPWLVPMPQMKGDGEYIEIVKSKNFSRGEERVGYHYGLGLNKEWEPATNQMGDFFLRSSVSRAVISGHLKRYTIQSASTTNKIILSPTLNSEQKGMVVSHLNLTLSHVQPASGQFQQPQQPQQLGNLVYTYNTPFSGNNEARQGHQRSDNEEYEYSSEEREHQQRHYRHRRSAVSDEQEFDSPESEDKWTQDEPKLDQAPETPLLPMYIGNKGQSIKQSSQIQIVKAAEKIAQQIGHDLQRPEQIPKEQTLAKYTILIRLVSIMNEKEMQEAAQQLYNKEEQGPKSDAWKAYRDAVAQSGTGPALLTVKQWIQNKKIQNEEAAEVIATMAESARQPTSEYMRTFYALATKEEVRSQATLNETAILSYANLVRKVYVDREHSHNQYPVQSFGSFRKNSAKQFVSQEVIPYLKQKLNHAVEQGDSHKVLVYTRALGNVADQKILAAFEPYLEGDKQVSQFQRLQMVLSLDKLATVHPKVARSVLYKIYQNAGEMQEIRAAAVYQLMKTTPPASMLQRMAQYTNVDEDEQVNAAVKTAIESAAQLEGVQFAELAENARSAEPLLTQDTYGAQYSRNHLRSYVVDQMNLLYKQNFYTVGSQDSLIPKGLKYYLRNELGGVKNELINVEAMVSSIEELTNVLEQQTEIHQQQQQQQKQNHQQAQQNQWSSEAIAKLLNIQNDEREQLEGSLLLQLGGGATRFFTMNNQTVELLPRVLREAEEALREGKNFHYTKFLNIRDIDISFPTDMGIPFVYTLDAPTVLHIQGHLRASAEPKISSGDKIHKPHTIKAEVQVQAVASTKLQAQIGFITPFDHQQYVAGFDKNVQVNIPVKSQIEIDIKNKQMHAQFQPIEQDKSTQIFHYSTTPYTAKNSVLDLEPVLKSSHAHPITSQDEEQRSEYQQTFGRANGLAFRVKYSSEQKYLDSRWAYEQLSRHDAISALMAPANDETLEQTKLIVEYAADQSSARNVHVRMGYEKRYESENEQSNDSNSANAEISQFSNLPQESKARQQQFAKMASAGIRSAEVSVYDVAVQFEGQNQVEYTATAALASGPADDKSRALVYIKKQSANPQESKPFQFAMSAKARLPNSNGLDFVYALKFDPTSTAQMDVAFGEDLQSSTKITLKAKFEKSEARKQYLQTIYRAKECRREMQHGNQHLSACANMTAEANLMDRVHLNIKYEDMSPKVQNMTHKLYNALRYMGYYNLDENTVNPKGNEKDNEVNVQARFEPDFESVNVTVSSQKIQSHFDNIRVNQWAKQVVAVHPVFRASSRLMGEAIDVDGYRPFCTVDKSAANTFDNKTYRIDLGHAWHVMLQYVPTFARQHESHQNYQKQQQEQQSEQFAILVRDSKSEEGKEVKMTIRTPETQGQLIEVDLKPQQHQGEASGSSPAAKVQVNQKQYQFDDKKSTDIEDGYIKIYALPNGEVKVEVRDSYYIIYDGQRVRFTAMHDKFRGAVRGLCGTFTGEESTDFLTPKNCILRNEEDFAATYAVEQEGRVQERKSHADKAQCRYEDVVYANVVSDYDAGRNHQQYKHGRQQQRQGHGYNSGSDSCTKHQTRYVNEDDGNTICFTIHPVSICKSSCNASGYFKKSVQAHCVQKSNITDLWKQQIEKGANPDFSGKQANRSIKVEVPESCSKY